MVARDSELHHATPRCLLSLHEKANSTSFLEKEGVQAWLEWEREALRWRVPLEISREDLKTLIETSEVVLERERHRLLYQSDWQRCVLDWAKGNVSGVYRPGYWEGYELTYEHNEYLRSIGRL